ncbi:hypothetical protein [Rhizobium leguminosarum]|uniref:hypothetical protein n=1 Tax=Rhizobium leguminosarum TaxID=384 RepID=UPI002E1171A0|nr:hypothetical protein U8Q02_39810 [Rhizobium leguminosarum]
MSTRIRSLSGASFRWQAGSLAVAFVAGACSLAALALRILHDINSIMLALVVLVASMTVGGVVVATAVCARIDAAVLRWMLRRGFLDVPES